MRAIHTKWDAQRYTIYDDAGYYLGYILARRIRVEGDNIVFMNRLGLEFAELKAELEEEE